MPLIPDLELSNAISHIERALRFDDRFHDRIAIYISRALSILKQYEAPDAIAPGAEK